MRLRTRPEPRADGDLASQLASRLEQVVDRLRDVSVRPAQKAARYLVLGAIGAVLATTAAVLVVIALLRLLDDDAFGHRVWITDFVLGGIFLGGGAFLLRRSIRSARGE